MFCRDERGVSMIETSVVVLVFFFFLFGVLEGGLMMRSDLTINDAVSDGVHEASAASTDEDADVRVLRALINASVAINASSLERVVIYRADSTNSPPPQACLDADRGVHGLCNVYGPQDIVAVQEFRFEPGTYWSPSERHAQRVGGSDVVGVYVRTHLDLMGVPVEMHPVVARWKDLRVESSTY